MESEERYIELRVAYPGSIVSAIGEGCWNGRFKKLENPFPRRYERLPGGLEQHVHLLPDWNLTYEVSEVVNGERTRWFFATLEGYPDIYPISEYGAKVYARREMSLRNVIKEYPPKPDLTAAKDWDEEG